MNEIRDIAENSRQDQVNIGLPNTGHWIYEHATYIKFSNTISSSLFCVTGYGGSGKSTLTKRLLEDTRLRYNTPAYRDMMSPMTARELRIEQHISGQKSPVTVAAAFFYQHDANVPAWTQLTGIGIEHINMLCSLLYQIFWQVPSLYSCWKGRLSGKHHPRDWSFDDLQEVFHNVRDHTDARLVIHLYIDALNESSADSHDPGIRPTRRKVMNLFDNLRTSSSTMVIWKIMLSTRELGGDMICILPNNTVRITDYNNGDIDAFIIDAMQRIREERATHQPEFPAYKIANFEALLKQQAKGVILWVKVVRDLIVGRLRKYELRSADLEDLTCDPSFDMRVLYTRMVGELQSSQQPDVVKAWLQWGVLAFSSLRVSEYKDAVALSDMRPASSLTHETFSKYRHEPNHEHATRNLLVSKCGGFLDLKNVSSSSTLSLAMKVQSLEWAEHDFVVEPGHHTATAFLLKKAAWPFQILEHEAHLDMVERSTKYLHILLDRTSIRHNTDMSTAVVSYLEDSPFLPYVLTNLPRHLALITKTEHAKRSVCHENIRKLFDGKPSKTVASCLLRLWTLSLSTSGLNDEFWCSCAKATMGNDELYVSRLTRLVETATHVVAANALRSILAAGLLTEKRVATVPVLKALILSAFSSDDPRMQDVLLFLSPRYDANSHALRGAYRTILHEALLRKTPSTGIAKLIAAGADVNHRNKLQSSPLHIAADSGDIEVSELLLCAGAEVDARDNSDKTPLHVAISKQHEMVVKLLLDHKARVDARTVHEDTPMSLCHEMFGHEAESIRRLLVDAGAQIILPVKNKQQGWMTIPIRPSHRLVERSVLKEVENAVEQLSKLQHRLGIAAVCGLGGTG
jgi:hypothetical protein